MSESDYAFDAYEKLKEQFNLPEISRNGKLYEIPSLTGSVSAELLVAFESKESVNTDKKIRSLNSGNIWIRSLFY